MRVSRVALALSMLAGLALSVPAHAEGSGSIGGTVTDETGLPLAGICVTAGNPDVFSFGSDETGADGTFTITGLEEGDYAIILRDCVEPIDYLTEWYEDEVDYWNADRVLVSNGGAVTGISAKMTLGGFITGTLLDDDGGAAATCVAAYSINDDWFDVAATTYTNFDDGTYRVGPLPPGNAMLLFGECGVRVPIERIAFPFGGVVIGVPPVPSKAPQGYVREWFDDHRGYGGDVVTVLPGLETPGIDAELAIAGGIVGKVTSEVGTPLKDICVDASAGNLGYGGTLTDENGFYEIPGLAAGSYKVSFYDCNDSTYRSEWYDNESSAQVADPVSVVRKEWTRLLDAGLAKRPRPDLAITKIGVSSVALETLDVKLAGSPWLRKIELDLANLGTATPGSEATLRIWAVSETDGHSQFIVEDTASTRPGVTEHRSYDWNGFGTIGDVKIYAWVCSHDDADRSNDFVSTRSYVGVGGTGFGVRPLQNGGYPYEGCGIIIVPVPKPRPEPL